MKTRSILKRSVLIVTTAFALLQPGFTQDEVPEVPDSLDLQTILEYALEHNHQIRTAKQTIESQEGLIMEVRAQALPSVSLNSSYNRQDEGLSETFISTQDPTVETWNLSISARQALYKGGAVKSAIRAQDLFQQSAELALRSVVNHALLEVKTRFYAVLLAREQIEVEQQNIELLKQTLDDAKKRFDAGSVSQFEVLRAEVLLSNAKTPLIRRQSDFRVAIDQLRQSMGYENYRRDSGNLEKVPELIGDLDYVPASFSLSESLEDALKNRPELLRLAVVTEAREEGITNARSSYKPEVDLVASYAKRNSSFDRSFDAGPDGWVVGVEASWNIFDGYRRKGQVLQAIAARDQSVIDNESLRLRIEVEVRQAISDQEEAAQLVASASKGVEQAIEALRLADNRYETGAISQLDVLEARVAMTQARTNLLEANYRHLVALASLERATGK